MKITDVKVFPVDEDKLKAYATITFDNCFIVRDLKVISGNKGYFIAMPSKKRKDGTFRDVAHPLNSETRKMIEDSVLEVYEKENVTDPAPASYHEDDTLDSGSDTQEAEGDDAGAGSGEVYTETAASTDTEPDTETATEIDTQAYALEEETADSAVDTDEDELTEAAAADSTEEEPTVEDTSPVESEAPVEPVEPEEREKGAEENPVFEPSDDPEKAFGYEE